MKINKPNKVILYSQDPNHDYHDVINILKENDVGFEIYNIYNNYQDCDVVLAFGGDGTFLRGANIAAQYNIPVIGFNYGHLGFLVSFPKDKEKDGIITLLEEKLQYELRDRISIVGQRYDAFNDIVIKSGPSERLLDLQIIINNQNVMRYKADGIIVSTSAGSTGYNMAAGGPIITSSTNSFAITPICPHSLTNKIIIFDSNDQLKIKLINNTEAPVKVDGKQIFNMSKDYEIVLEKSKFSSKVVLPDSNVFQILHEKMNWDRL